MRSTDRNRGAARRIQRSTTAAPLMLVPNAGELDIARRLAVTISRLLGVEQSTVKVAQLMLEKLGQRHVNTGGARFITLDDPKRPPWQGQANAVVATLTRQFESTPHAYGPSE